MMQKFSKKQICIILSLCLFFGMTHKHSSETIVMNQQMFLTQGNTKTLKESTIVNPDASDKNDETKVTTESKSKNSNVSGDTSNESDESFSKESDDTTNTMESMNSTTDVNIEESKDSANSANKKESGENTNESSDSDISESSAENSAERSDSLGDDSNASSKDNTDKTQSTTVDKNAKESDLEPLNANIYSLIPDYLEETKEVDLSSAYCKTTWDGTYTYCGLKLKPGTRLYQIEATGIIPSVMVYGMETTASISDRKRILNEWYVPSQTDFGFDAISLCLYQPNDPYINLLGDVISVYNPADRTCALRDCAIAEILDFTGPFSMLADKNYDGILTLTETRDFLQAEGYSCDDGSTLFILGDTYLSVYSIWPSEEVYYIDYGCISYNSAPDILSNLPDYNHIQTEIVYHIPEKPITFSMGNAVYDLDLSKADVVYFYGEKQKDTDHYQSLSFHYMQDNQYYCIDLNEMTLLDTISVEEYSYEKTQIGGETYYIENDNTLTKINTSEAIKYTFYSSDATVSKWQASAISTLSKMIKKR